MMNENRRLVLIVLAFLLVGCILWYFTGGQIGPTPNGGTEAESPRRAEQPATASGDDYPAVLSGETASGETLRPGRSHGTRAPSAKVPKGRSSFQGTVTWDFGLKPQSLRAELTHVTWAPYERAPESRATKSAQVNQGGEFKFTGLGAGRFVIRFSGEGVMGFTWAEISKRNVYPTVNPLIYRSGGVSGRVQTHGGKAAAFAWLAPVLRGSKTSPWSPFAEAFTSQFQVAADKQGRFTFSNLPVDADGSSRVKFAVMADNQPTLITDFVPVGSQGVELVLQEGGRVEGHAIDASTGVPMPQIRLRVASSEFSADAKVVQTDRKGFFQLPHLAAGEHTISVAEKGIVQIGGPVTFRVAVGQPTTGIRVEASAGGIISGRIYDTFTGKGLRRVKVTASPLGLGEAGSFNASTDKNGEYTLEGLPQNTYRIHRADIRGYPRRTSGSTAVKVVVAGPGQDATGVDYALTRPPESQGFTSETP